MDVSELKRLYRRKRRSAVLIALFAAFCAGYLANAAFYREPLNLIFAAINGGIAWLAWRRRPADPGEALAPQAQEAARALHDRSRRAAFNWVFFSAFLAASVIFEGLSMSVNNSKPAETLEFFQMHVASLHLMAVGVAASLALSRWMGRRVGQATQPRFGRYLIGCAAASLAYWSAVLALFGVFNTASYFSFWASAALYALLVLLFNLRLRGRVLFSNFAFSRVKLGIVLGAAALAAVYLLMQRDVWLTQPYINRVPNVNDSGERIEYDEATGVYTLTGDGGDFRVLQLTDIHLGGSFASYANDLKALKACFALIDHTRPDLVVVTGDLCYPIGLASFSLNNTAPVMQFSAFMRNTGVPWAFTYGNHDTESVAATSASGLDEVFRSLSYRTSKNLLYPYVQPEITGRSNQLIEVRNPDGTLNTALFLIDSNAYTGNGLNDYDFIHDDQVEWYADQVRRLAQEEGRGVSSMAFFHIPLQQYRDAYELYEAGSDEVTWYFGSNDEKLFNKVCCSDYPSELFDRMKALGSTKAVFCGHDHYNNMSLEYQGIRLTYGMSIDYLVMPGIARDTKQRGGTLITLHPDSSFDIEQVPLTSIQPQ